MIYIREAHAIDKWNIGESAGELVYEHKTLKDRIECISKLKKKNNIQFPIYPDDMNDSLMIEYSLWPVRCYVIYDNVIKYISVPENGEVNFCDIFQYALELTNNI
jgi:hypothetical protein